MLFVFSLITQIFDRLLIDFAKYTRVICALSTMSSVQGNDLQCVPLKFLCLFIPCSASKPTSRPNSRSLPRPCMGDTKKDPSGVNIINNISHLNPRLTRVVSGV